MKIPEIKYKKCAVCRDMFILRKNAKSFKTRQLCPACRKALKKRWKL
jgi:hypothetical protein